MNPPVPASTAPQANDPGSTMENNQVEPKQKLIELGLKFMTAAVSLAGLAVIGQAVSWVRFDAAQLPANQAVVAMDQDEGIVVGVVALSLFLVVALVAVGIVYGLDRTADPKKRQTRYGLTAIMTAGVIAGSVLSLGGTEEFWLIYSIVVTVLAAGLAVFLTKDETDIKEYWPKVALPVVGLLALLVVPGIAAEERGWHPLLFAATAVVLGGVCLGIGRGTGTIFRWYGVAVFLSVVLFGAVVTAARTYETPKVQPVAALIESEGETTGAAGIYIADGTDRFYVGTATPKEDDDEEIVSGSGQLRWFPCDEITAYIVGDFQSVPNALRTADDMLEELEPGGADQAEAAAEEEAADDADEPEGTCED